MADGNGAPPRRRRWLLIAAAALVVAASAGLAAASALIVDRDEEAGGTVQYECISMCDQPEGTDGQAFVAIASPNAGYRLERWHCVTDFSAGLCPGSDAADEQYPFTFDGSLRSVTPVFASIDTPPGPALTSPSGRAVAPERLAICTTGDAPAAGVNLDPLRQVSPEEVERRAFGAASRSVAAIQGGSGWVWSADGVLITNHHLLLDASGQLLASIDVVLGADEGTPDEGTVYAGAPVGFNAALNLAAVRIAREGLAPLAIGTSSHVSPGQLAVGAGFRHGGTPAPTIGSAHGIVTNAVAQLPPRIVGSGHRVQGVIESDAPAADFIGGPLLDSEGRVFGMISQHVTDSGLSHGLVRALPIDMIQRFVPALLEGGVAQIPYLGLQAVPGNDGNARVVGVDAGGPAQAAGIRPGDSISAVSLDADGSTLRAEVATGHSLNAFIGLCAAPGDEATLSIDRREVSLTVAPAPAEREPQTDDAALYDFHPEPPTRLPVARPSNGAVLPLDGAAYANREALSVDLFHAARRAVVAIDNGEHANYTGWLWPDGGGLVVTSADVLICGSCRGRETPLWLWLPHGSGAGGARLRAEVAGIFEEGLPPGSGVALLKLQEDGLEGLATLPFSDAPPPQAGQPLFSIGRHHGASVSISRAALDISTAAAGFEQLLPARVQVKVDDHLLGGQVLIDGNGRGVGMLLTRNLDLQGIGGQPHAVSASAIAEFVESLNSQPDG